MKKFSTGILCLAFMLIASVSIFAEQIVLKNGDRISGKIVSRDNEKVIVETEFAGRVTIPAAQIANIIDDAKAPTTVSESDDKEITGADSENKEAGEPEISSLKSEAKVFYESKSAQSGFMSGWEGNANIGLSLTSGNSDTQTLSAGIAGAKVSGKNKFTAYANSLIGRNKIGGSRQTVSEAYWGGLRLDRDLSDKIFAFGSYDFERDLPQRLNLRSVLGAGLGYHAIKNDKTELDLFSGAAWNRTWYRRGIDTTAAEFLVGDTLKHRFNERTVFNQRFILYPNLSDGGEYRFVWDSTLTSDITKRIGWFVTVGDRYNSAPLAGVKSNDLLFATGLKVGFGGSKK